jgi:hypothetical protein
MTEANLTKWYQESLAVTRAPQTASVDTQNRPLIDT